MVVDSFAHTTKKPSQHCPHADPWATTPVCCDGWLHTVMLPCVSLRACFNCKFLKHSFLTANVSIKKKPNCQMEIYSNFTTQLRKCQQKLALDMRALQMQLQLFLRLVQLGFPSTPIACTYYCIIACWAPRCAL